MKKRILIDTDPGIDDSLAILLTGLLSNIIWGLLIDPNALPWF